ncbi:MAG: 50S ribosomal protein L20 [Pseudomonadota bacterium]
MPRAKRGFKARQRRNKFMKAAKGFVGGRRRQYRATRATVMKSWVYSYRDRRARKRDFRRLWITRINAAARMCGATYSRLVSWLKTANVEPARKELADKAVHEFGSFTNVVEQGRQSAK